MKKTFKFSNKFTVLAVIIAALIWGSANFFGALQKFNLRVYDLFLSLKKAPQTSSEILLVDVDNPSLEAVGPWPWSRDIWANTILRMKELGAKTAVFDIEFLSKSNLSPRSNSQEAIAKIFANQGLFTSEEAFYQAVRAAMYSDNDAYFASSIQFFGDAWLTINTSNLDISYTDDDLNYALTRFSFPAENPQNLIFEGNVKSSLESEEQTIFDKLRNAFLFRNTNWENAQNNFADIYNALSPALSIFAKSAKGAGFTNVFIDSDGSRRRVELLSERRGKLFAQLVFAPLLSKIKPEKIVREKRSLILYGANMEDSSGKPQKKDIVIPLDESGRMFINWQHNLFQDSFRHASIMFLVDLESMENNISTLIKTLSSYNWEGGNLQYKAKADSLASDYDTILQYKEYLLSKCNGIDLEGNAVNGGLDESELSEYFALRSAFFDSALEFASGKYLDEIGEFLFENLDSFGESANELASNFTEIFDTLKNECEVYATAFKKQKEAFSGAFCIVGNTASGTTDLGTTPFERAYPNVGTHANVYNTIMTQDFITPVDWWIPLAFATVLSICFALFSHGKKVFVQAFLGILLIASVISIPAAFLALFGYYVPVVASTLVALMAFVVVIISSFLTSEQDKKFITNAFSQCLSKDVVKQLIDDPSSFKLGGEKREMTAMFTDIQKFSSFSELLSASQLVALLNYYLTKMSDIIMDERGTVDKYEGDAIVALVGAPLKMEGGEHAVHACAAALKMKKAEIVMNEEILRIASAPKPEDMSDDLYDAFCIMVKNKKILFTRIGLNSGEMTAGYMGSENKKNYTMMGNNVNLASRLEGVNKQYSTGGIMISEHTEKLLGDRFIVRPLDRVQVVNVKTPLRLYELVAEKEDADENLVKYMDNWRVALKAFEAREYAKALEMFKKLAAHKADDKVVRYYISLTEKFFVKGKYPVEKDDVGVSFNPENGVFTLLQK